MSKVFVVSTMNQFPYGCWNVSDERSARGCMAHDIDPTHTEIEFIYFTLKGDRAS